MRTYHLILALIMLISIIGCNKEEVVESDFKVSGFLKSDGKPLVNASVNINGLEQFKTITNSEGYFEVKNVSAGTHSLNTKKTMDDGSFIQKDYVIEVHNKDLQINSLILPNPVLIDTIILDSLSNIATIIWNKSISDDFREYKLYSHTSSGLDETTGTLEHVTIDSQDTTFSLTISNATTLYFRVFVLDEHGQLGGSNIENVSTVNKTYFVGSDFEDESLFFSTWQTVGNIYIIDSVSYNNSKSLYLFSNYDTIDYYSKSYYFSHPEFLIEQNQEYVLSFWYKVRGLANMMKPFAFGYIQDNQNNLLTDFGLIWNGEPIIGPIEYISETAWIYYEKTFFPNSNSAIKFYFNGDANELFIDDLQLKKKL